uniref:Uncharacterized protein n=1 Tax=Daphnia galeata TaxID=27404 RepID=A0A8J2WJK2_9CRUS|nr:unnamed protein product [Daphnia galeata]
MNPISRISAPRPSRASMEGVSPLMYSCQQGDTQQVRHLIQRKPICVKECDRTGKTALHYCAENTTADGAQLLVKANPALVNQPDEEGYTPLHLAVIAGNRTMLRYLLDHGAEVNLLDNERHSVVHWATVCGELESLDVVLDAGAEASVEDIHGAYPIHYAAQMCGNNKKTMGSGDGSGQGGGGGGPASSQRYTGLAALKKLINHGVPVDVIDRDGRQPLLWAASSGSADAILALSNAGASVMAADKDGLTALHCAASRGHSDCLETLVALCGAEVDLLDANGCTALFYAVTLGHADCAQLLLDCGANPNHQDKKGRTPAYCGATKGQTETLRLLVQHQADLWLRSTKGDVPLHEAVACGRKDLVLWILRQCQQQYGENGTGSVAAGPGIGGAHVVNNDGRSPLHIAAINNNVEMCKILIDHGAEINCIMRTARGQLITPLDAALRRGNRGCAKFLQLHGGLAAAKLTDSRALQRALSQAYTENQRRVSVMVHNHAEMMDYPTDSQMSGRSSMIHLPHLAGTKSRTVSRLEDSATQTQVEESFFSENKDGAEMQLSSAGLRLGETESGLRRRRIRRRAQQRRSLTDPRPPPNDEELRWKSRQRYSDDSGSESDDEQHLPGSRYHQQQRPNMSQYVSDGGAPGTGGSGGDGSGRVNGSSNGLNNINTVHLEPIVKSNEVVTEPALRSQSILSNVGTESSGQKDSGFSDLVGRSEEDINSSAVIRRTDSATLLDHIRSPEQQMNGPDGENLNRSSSSLNNKTMTHSPLMDEVDSSRKRTFLLRRTKSERRSEHDGLSPHPPTNPPSERIKYKAEIPISVIRAAQAKTRRYNLERKIFQQLLDLKQMQIRIGQANEQVFAKRLIDGFRKDAVTVGLRPYDGSYSFQQLEVYLYSQLRLVQGGRTLLPLVDSATDREDVTNGLYGDVETESTNGGSRTMPVDKCTHTTQRCPHAMYAYTTLPPACYTGVPCAAFIPYHKHHRPVTQQQQHQPNHPGTAKSTTENGRIILPKLNLNNNINQKNNTPSNKSSN